MRALVLDARKQHCCIRDAGCQGLESREVWGMRAFAYLHEKHGAALAHLQLLVGVVRQ